MNLTYVMGCQTLFSGALTPLPAQPSPLSVPALLQQSPAYGPPGEVRVSTVKCQTLREKLTSTKRD